MHGSARSLENTGQDEIEQAIQRNESALQKYTRASHPNEWATAHRNLAIAYAKRQRGSPAENTEQVIAHYEHALEVITKGNARQRWAAIQANLGLAYSLRIRADRATNLECALVHYQQALEVYDRQSHPTEWGVIHNDLGTIYHHRIRGDRAGNIERAIAHYRQALEERTREKAARSWATTQANLASAYCLRIVGDRADNIEHAIERYYLALEVRTVEGDPVAWAQTQNNLANAYQLRLLGDHGQDIEQAIRIYESVLATGLRGEAPVDWAMAHANLAAAYSDREAGDAADNLELALSHLHDALQVRTLESMPNEWAMTHNELGITYRRRVAGDRLSNLESAIRHYKLALTVHTYETHPWDWAMLQNNLGLAYAHLSAEDSVDHSAIAAEHFRAALTVLQPTVHPAQCKWVARHLGDLCTQQELWQDAASAYELALQAAERTYQASLLRRSREAELRETGDLHRRAAYAMAKVGRLESAVTALENGRARALSNALARDHDMLLDVRQNHPELLTRYETIATELHKLEARELQSAGGLSDYRGFVELVEGLYEELHDLIDQLHGLGGQRQLLSTASFADIARLVTSTPLVYIVATSMGGMALIVGPNADVGAIWLENLTEETVNARLFGESPQSRSYAGAYREWRGKTNDAQARLQWHTALNSTLDWLDQVLLGPMRAALLQRKLNEAMLVPFGALSLLPLHAVCPELVLAYTPNARVLGAHRHRPLSPGMSVLVVEDPDPEGPLALPMSDVEVTPLFQKHARQPLRLVGREASRARVIQEAGCHDAWHLVTHGEVDWNDPLDSFLVLADGDKLTLRDILALRLNISLAVLSACETGVPDEKLYDEVTSLATGLLQAGAACVIGSLWAVESLSTALLLRRFYQILIGEEHREARTIAAALSKAQAWLRSLSADDAKMIFFDLLSDPAIAPRSQEALMGWLLNVISGDQKPFAHPYYWAGFFATGNAFSCWANV